MSKQLTKEQIKAKLIEAMPKWSKDPLLFVKAMWGLTPQPVKPEYKTAVSILIEQHKLQDIRPEWFEPFQRGLHLTWQQWLIFLCVKASVNGEQSKRISIASAHGIGKSCSISLIVIWRLFCFNLAQIGVTAPTSQQLKDVLWKEISIWIGRMPQYWGEYFEWSQGYIRMAQKPNDWFASARTSRKDSTESLAGIHGPAVTVIADEASGVLDELFNTMEGSLTEKDILIILISNPTRLAGYFWETHKKPDIAAKWQHLQFDNISSPVVRDDYNQDIIDRHGRNSDEYRIRVLGKFPKADAVDDKGYIPILGAKDIKEIEVPNTLEWIGEPIMGIDPAGGGRDKSVWVIRDQFKAAVVKEEKTSNKYTIAKITRTLAKIHKVKPERIVIDSFGIGTESAVELASEGFKIKAVNVGDTPKKDSKERELYLNLRAQYFMALRKAILSGFELVRNKAWVYELPTIKYCRNARGKIQILSKKEIRKDSGKSPDFSDATMLTFHIDSKKGAFKTTTRSQRSNQPNPQRHRTTNNIHSAI